MVGTSPAMLDHIKIFATFACNLRCPHCVHAGISSRVDPHPGDLDLVGLERFLAAAAASTPSLRIYLAGGEPLLSPRFVPIARLVRSLGLTYKTITNGLLLEESLTGLLSAPPRRIWITFNGAGAVHDSVVGRPGAFEAVAAAARRAVPRLAQAGVGVGGVLLITPASHDRLCETLDRLEEFGLDEVVVQHLSFLSDTDVRLHREVYRSRFGADPAFVFGEGASGAGIDPAALARELARARARTSPLRVVVFPDLTGPGELEDYYGPAPRRWLARRCARADRELWVLPDGSVTACFAHRIGHVGQSLEQLRSSRELAEWRRAFDGLTGPLPGCMRCHRLYM